MIMRYLYLGLLTLFAAQAFGQDKQPLRMSLDECMDYAIKHSYTVKNAQLDVLIQQAQNSQTASLAYPSINGKYEFNYFPRPQQSFLNGKVFGGPDGIVPVAFTIPFSSVGSLSASQILFDGSVLVALQARNTILELARQKAALNNEEIKYNVYKTYYSYIVAANQLDILIKSIGIARLLAHESDVAYENGLIEKIAVERNNVQINNYINDSITNANMLRTLEQLLKYQMGMDINTPIVLTETDLKEHTNTALKILNEETDYKSIAMYKLATTGLKLNEYNLKRYKLSALPSVVGIGSFGYNYGAEYFKDIFKIKSYESYSLVGLQVNLPIFNGFKRTYQIKESQLNIEKSRNEIENTKLAIDFQTTQARTNLRNALVQLKSQEKNIALAADVLDLAQKKYKAGVGDNVEVNLAQTSQLQTQNAYFMTLINIINAEADLKKALGMFN